MAINVAIVGCGLIGRRRAQIASEHPNCSLRLVVDHSMPVAVDLARQFGVAAASDWREVLHPAIDLVVVSTPNHLLCEIGCAALVAGKHVLIEKPMGRSLREAETLASTARVAERILRVGFNHRYHPALAHARIRLSSGAIGDVINIRARYGHGGRPGYEAERRGDPLKAGGGELTDQGVHLIDLLRWFAGDPTSVYCSTQSAVWPIAPLEDNAFAILHYASGIVAILHSSWTQWKNLFSFEIFGSLGSLTVEGLGKSYGIQRCIETHRNPKGGLPDTNDLMFDGPDLSWAEEWADFLQGIDANPYYGSPQDGVAVMRTVDALYRSARTGLPTHVDGSISGP